METHGDICAGKPETYVGEINGIPKYRVSRNNQYAHETLLECAEYGLTFKWTQPNHTAVAFAQRHDKITRREVDKLDQLTW